MVITDDEGMSPNLVKAVLLVKVEGFGVFLPDTEPYIFLFLLHGSVDGLIYQIMSQALALERFRNIDTLNFKRVSVVNIGLCRRLVQLQVAGQLIAPVQKVNGGMGVG